MQHPLRGGEVEQGNQVAGSRPRPRLPTAHAAGVDLQPTRQLPPGQPGSLPEAVQPLREVLGELLRLDVVDPLLLTGCPYSLTVRE